MKNIGMITKCVGEFKTCNQIEINVPTEVQLSSSTQRLSHSVLNVNLLKILFKQMKI